MSRPRTPLIATSAAVVLAGAAAVGGLIDFGAPNLEKVREEIGGPRAFAIGDRIPAPQRGMLSFLNQCEQVVSRPDDPIKLPKRPGMSHEHDFMGNPAADANTTLARMARTPVRCRLTDDRSGYWVPAAFQGDRKLRITQNLIYYKASAFHANPREVQPIPFGLHMIAGNADATRNQDRQVGFWQFPDKEDCVDCVSSNNSAGKNAMITAPSPRTLQLRINFPNCWNGRDLDSPDHRSHVAYATRGTCPATHPVKIAQLVWFVSYENASGGSGFRLSSGPWHTFHADFVNLWEPHTMETLTRVCLQAGQRCRNIMSDNMQPDMFWGTPQQFASFFARADYRHTPGGSAAPTPPPPATPPPAPVNPRPRPGTDAAVVRAGRDRIARAGRVFALRGAATLNGRRLSPRQDHRGNGSSARSPRLVWRQVAGPRRGIRVIRPNRTVTPVTGARPGTYVFDLRLVAGTARASDRVRIVVR